MSRTRFTRPEGKRIAATAVTLALVATPLVSCSTEPQQTDQATSTTETEETASEGTEGTSANGAEGTASVTGDWQTLGEALDGEMASYGAGWNDDYYVAVFTKGDSTYRVVAQMDQKTSEAIDNLDWTQPEVNEEITKVVSSLPLVSIQDLTADIVGQAELDSLVGKTGSEVVAEGFTFAAYNMYGGDQTGVSYDRGPIRYDFVFDVTVPESAAEDGGASVLDATVAEAHLTGAADSATDPTDPI